MKNCLPIACLLLLATGPVHAQKGMDSPIGELTFDHGLPTAETRQKLYHANDFQRAVQAVQWVKPAMQNSLVADVMRTLGVRDHAGNARRDGIPRGEPFEPDERLRKILVEAERVGLAMMINEVFSPRFAPKGMNTELYPGTDRPKPITASPGD